MGLITAKGSAAVTSASQSSVDLSKVMIRLKKEGGSTKVRLLGYEDYVEYSAIGDFNLKVFTQPVRDGKDYFVEAGKLAKAGKVDEKFSGLYIKKRYVIAFADLTKGMVRYLDVSQPQFKNFVSQIEDFKELIEDGSEAVFTLKLTGEGTNTTYNLQYVPKPKAAELEKFHEFDGKTVEISDFESVLQPRTAELQVSVLKEAGFPVEEHFPEIKLEKAEGTADTDGAEESPLDII